MDAWWSTPVVWWVLVGIAVLAELITGTFYLLMVAVGLAAGALAAHAGLGLAPQMVLAAVVGSVLVLALYLRRSRLAALAPSAQANPDVQQDVGAVVHVDHWHADGTAHVQYRGAQWTVQHHGSAPLHSGQHRVVQVVGNRLLVEAI
ncbi:NfeD family protein [Curvibacter sp. CHRR-16]|uniref:NfeD family protein n=1 Tax=Curvibacter sp. CHRR-16 TaxID=2835872 RepID=UPI001BDAD2A0|nr:NfeD family protein [Curvibacter sp. CHRR-16]MBT0569029.1 NfeD family protein [Curvibacter sp. CHRR-16]